MEKNKRTVGEFIVTDFERYVTDEQINGIKTDNVMDAENLAYISEHRTIPCVRIEHRSGIWAIEIPTYSVLYHTIQSFGDDIAEQTAMSNILWFIMESTVIIGDEKYFLDCLQAKKELSERSKLNV